MNLTEFSIKRSRIAFAIFALLAFGGLIMYQNLPQDSMPPYTVRVATIVAQFPGAGPERVEQLVTDKIEKKVQEVPEVKEINSDSRTGLSVVTISLKNEVSPEKLQSVWDLIRRKLNTAELPAEASWSMNDDGIGEVYGILVGLVSDGYDYDEMKDYADDIRDQFIKLPDAAKVEIGGVQPEEIIIDFDNTQLAKYGLSASLLQNTIASRNILYSGGQINQEDERIVLEPTGNFDELKDLEKTIIPSQRSSEVIYLGDITNIRRGYTTPQQSLVRVDGKPALSIAINLKAGSNIVRLGEAVDAKITELRADIPVGLELKRLSSMDGFVDGEVNNFVSNLMQSVLIVLAVMLIFLGLRTGFIIASLIPMVTLATFLFMGMIGMGLNQVTLAALIMALGMMVDNAVVVSETIMVKLEEGMDRFRAAVDACSELFIPLLISTLTTSVAFMAFFLSDDIMGDIVGPLFVVISAALLFSWFLSLSLIAMLCYYFIKVGDREYKGIGGALERIFDNLSKVFDRFINFLKGYYERLIAWGLRFRLLIIAAVMGLFIFSLFLFQFIPFLFFPDSERNLVTVDINLPIGTNIDRTNEVVASIESFMQDRLVVGENRDRGIVDWSSFVGEGPASYDLGYTPDEPNTSYAHMLLNTSSGDDNGLVINALDSFTFNSFPAADVRVSRLAGGGGGTPIEIIVSGNDPKELSSISDELKKILKRIPGTKNVKDDWGAKTKKLVIDIDQEKARLAGLTNQDIAISLRTALDGFNTGSFREGEDNLPIIMRNEKGDELNVDNLEGLNIYAQSTGANVPLIQVADIIPQWQLPRIKRKDLFRTIRITSEVNENANAAEIVSVLSPELENYASSWKRGYTYSLGGDAQSSADSMGSVAAWLPLCGFIILLLLIIQFNSVRKTMMVLLTIPLGIIGVVFGLLLLQSYFGFFAFLGMISLAGIVINNAIVLIDRIEIEQRNGLTGTAAIVEACRARFRPILLTTFTTVLGLIPLYMGGGIMWEPLAASIMIGLLFGTIITLLFIPVMYSLLFKVKA